LTNTRAYYGTELITAVNYFQQWIKERKTVRCKTFYEEKNNMKFVSKTWYHNTQQNDTQYNDTQHNGTEHYTYHNGTQHNNTKRKDAQHNDTKYKDKNASLSITTPSMQVKYATQNNIMLSAIYAECVIVYMMLMSSY